MTLSLRQKLLVVLTSAAMVLAVGGVAVWGLHALRESTERVAHTREVIATVDGVVAELTAAESALRAYEATGERGYLALVGDAPARVREGLVRLRRLTADNPPQGRRVLALEGAVEQRLQALRIASSGQGGEVRSLVATGTRLMQRVRSVAASVRSEEERRLAVRTRQDQRRTRQAVSLVVLSALLAALLAVLLGRALIADSEARTRANRRLESQQAELEAQNQRLQEQQRELAGRQEELRAAAAELERSNARLLALNAELERSRQDEARGRAEAEALRERAEQTARVAEAARRLADAARAAAQRSLQETTLTQEVRSRFMAMTTHEIRQPINAILGFAQLLELGITGALSEGQQVHVQRILGSARHLRGLVDDFLDLAKAEAGQLTVERVVAPVDRVATEAIDLVTPQAAERGVSVVWSCAAGATHYAGDPDRVRQILVNLLSNAVKFSPPGAEVRLECELLPEADDGRIVYHVRDGGPGIPAEEIPRLFDPYIQAADGRSHKGSTGLGLTVSRKLAELMGGEIRVCSAPGEGSTFSLVLPLQAAAEAGRTTDDPFPA